MNCYFILLDLLQRYHFVSWIMLNLNIVLCMCSAVECVKTELTFHFVENRNYAKLGGYFRMKIDQLRKSSNGELLVWFIKYCIQLADFFYKLVH